MRRRRKRRRRRKEEDGREREYGCGGVGDRRRRTMSEWVTGSDEKMRCVSPCTTHTTPHIPHHTTH